MSDKIKKFFQKKKQDAKFKMAGPGHKLSGEQASRPRVNSSTPVGRSTGISRSVPSSESKQAAAAALARLGERRRDNTSFNTSLAAIQAQVRREMEAEKKAKETPPAPAQANPEPLQLEASPHLAVQGVYFKCPMIGHEVLSKEEWNVKIKEFLYEQLEEERGLTACLMIHSCNKREKVELCVETLCKYLENIIQYPDEEKYQRIRISNRVFQERVLPVEGSQDLLMAAGFINCTLPYQDGEEEFLVFSPENLEDADSLQILIDALHSAEPVALELDRNLQVLLPSQVGQPMNLPPVFFSMTSEEVKREQQLRTEAIEKSMMLRTKAMREKEEQREMRRYRYALIRVRFPDGVFLQGTFSVFEKLEAVTKFVNENLENEDLPFMLVTATGHRLTENDAERTLVDLRLVPATVLLFSWEPMIADQLGAGHQTMYLKPEIMMLLQSM